MEHPEIAATVAEESTDFIYISDPDSHELVYINKACRRMLGNPPDSAWRGRTCHQVLQHREAPCDFCNQAKLSTDYFCCWSYYNTAYQRYFSVRDKLVELNGRLMRLDIASDMTDIELANRALRRQLITEETLMDCIRCLSGSQTLNESITRLLSIVGNYYAGSRAYIFEFDREAGTMRNTYAWCREDIAPQNPVLESVPLSAVDRWIQRFYQSGELYIPALDESVDRDSDEYKMLSAQGIDSLVSVPLIEEEEIIGLVGVDDPRENFDDLRLLRSLPLFLVEELSKRRMTERLWYLSYTDTLTNVGNRHKYIQRIEALEQEPPASLGTVYLDINGLKLANDQYGHEFGDHIIRHAAQILSGLCPGEVYRIGGDEFIGLCPGICRSDFSLVIRALRRQATEDSDFKVAIGSSWTQGANIDVLRQAARSGQMMFVDKQDYYSQRTAGEGDYHFQLTSNLLHELEEGLFFVELQPQLDLRTGELRGAEALVRKRGIGGERIPPLRFIPSYESEGLVRHVDFFVLETVCALLSAWRERGAASVPLVAVNFSRVTMIERDIVSKLLKVCDKYHIPPGRVKLEVTESTDLMDRDMLRDLAAALKEAGFTISLDDFGAEYSNLSLLSEVGFDELKLDKSLVDHLESNQNAVVITDHTIQVCKDLSGITSVAEGVETAGQRSILLSLGCDVGQGYLFDRPMSIEAFTEKYMKTGS